MIFPAKHENLQRTLLVIGADIISHLKKRDYNLEKLFDIMKEHKQISVDQFYNTITFLWITGIVDINEFNLFLKIQ